jgi:dihydroxyacetone kinase
MTSLNMNGFSISVLHLKLNNSAMILELLDQNANAPAWPKTCGRDVVPFEYTKSSISIDARSFSCSIDKENYIRVDSRYSNMLKFFLKTIAEDLISTKQFLNDLDSGCGDGDCGNSMAKVSESLLKNLENNTFEFHYPHEVS